MQNEICITFDILACRAAGNEYMNYCYCWQCIDKSSKRHSCVLQQAVDKWKNLASRAENIFLAPQTVIWCVCVFFGGGLEIHFMPW